ncbi:hypothetical protein IWW50_000311 [Coemansia erecta]|nr:hypothetical protein GGF43_000451 [Coemansia sp. RSA 2618]KAJ2830397.1 hypothetical protein IWW50_000311 [Coemansia erecta]
MTNNNIPPQESWQTDIIAMLTRILENQVEHNRQQEERIMAFSTELSNLANMVSSLCNRVQPLNENILNTSGARPSPALHGGFDGENGNPFMSPRGGNNPIGTRPVPVQSTPTAAQIKVSRYDSAYYGGLGCEYDSQRIPLDALLECLGDGWHAAYDAVSADICADIAARTHDYCVHNGLGRMETEDQRQAVTNHLFQLIEKHLVPLRADSPLMLHWEDRHELPLQNGRKPDGILRAGICGLETRWSSVVAPIELKSASHGHGDNILRGQLIQDFLDMAEHQPRRFILGLAGAGACRCEFNVYLCTPSGLFFSTAGILPSSDDVTDMRKDLVRFILTLYEMLPRDSGFLPQTEHAMPSRFKVSDIPNCEPSSIRFGQMDIVIPSRQSLGGRHSRPVGSQSWVYHACICVAGSGSTTAVLKFIWHPTDGSEIAVHCAVQKLPAPYVSRLLH